MVVHCGEPLPPAARWAATALAGSDDDRTAPTVTMPSRIQWFTGYNGCETLRLDRSHYHRFNVIWNNSFRKIVSIVGVKVFLVSPVLLSSTTNVLYNRRSIGLILSKYCIPPVNMTASDMLQLH